MGEFLAGLAVAGFAFFIYTQFKKEDKPRSGGSGGSVKPGSGGNVHKK